MKIPRIIHFFWDGEVMLSNMEARIDRWRRIHPNWNFRRWSTVDIDCERCKYAQMAHARKEWAYLSDYARVQALYEEGGIYVDTDVELIRSFEPLLNDTLHIGYMHNCALGTAVIVSPPHHPVIRGILDYYRKLNVDKTINNNAIFTEYFLQAVPQFKLDGRFWSNSAITVHPKTVFEQIGFRNAGFAVHLYNRSWAPSPARGAFQARTGFDALFVLKRAMRCCFEQMRCHYLPHYLRDRYGLPIHPPVAAIEF